MKKNSPVVAPVTSAPVLLDGLTVTAEGFVSAVVAAGADLTNLSPAHLHIAGVYFAGGYASCLGIAKPADPAARVARINDGLLRLVVEEVTVRGLKFKGRCLGAALLTVRRPKVEKAAVVAAA